MLIPGNLGFRFVAVVFFVVFPVIGVVLRRKWRQEVARREEINRLMVLAAEEAARAELETSVGYYVAPPVTVAAAAVAAATASSIHRVCAVCYTPTSNRCAQCKSVNYCSGKCQIIHWRQGHKDECRPSLANSDINDEASSFVGNTWKSPYSDDYIIRNENDGLQFNEQGENSVEGRGLSSPTFSSSYVSVEDGDAANDNHQPTEESALNSVRHDSSVKSGTLASFSSHETHDTFTNESSSDDDCLHILNSVSSKSSTSGDSFETASNSRKVEQIKPVNEKCYRRVHFDGGVKEDTLSGETSSSGLRVNHSIKSSVEPAVPIPGFWDVTLEASRTNEHLSANNAQPKPVGASIKELPNLKSDVQLSSELSSGPSSNLHSEASKMVDNNLGVEQTDKVAVKTISANKESVPAIRRQRSTLLSSKSPSTKVIGADESYSKSGAALDTSKDVRANILERNNQDTRQSLASPEAVVSPNKTNDSSSSGLKRETASAAMSVKAGRKSAIPPQIVRSIPNPVGGKSPVLKAVEQLRAPRSLIQGDRLVKIGEKALFAYDSFVKLYHWNKVEFRPSGLINCGNSCYANAVLQCLAFTPPLTAYLLQGLHSNACVKKEWCFTCEFERLILKAKEEGLPQSPISILSQIQKIGSHLTNGREEDAHEFLRYVIETMQSICLQEAHKKYSTSLAEETTLMGLAFGGYLRSKIKCTKCHGKSERQERMMDLTVEIEGDIETLEDALRHFTRTESLDGENKYHCARCKSYEKAKKKLNILEAPNILTIALKRFHAGKFGKLNKSIQFPEILNLAPYMRGGSDRAPIYRLYGVVVHLDTMNASFTGHYVCYVRNGQNKWFKIDDSMVTPVELDQVLNKGAYMLFYSRCSPRAPRSIRSTIVSCDLPSMINNPTVNISRVNHNINASMRRDLPARAIHLPNDYEFDSSSDNFSEFSNSDGVSTSTDSTQESNSADDISEFIFGQNSYFRSSDSDTSSSSSASSSPVYMKRSPLSYSERYASGLPEHNVMLTDDSKTAGGVNFLHSNSHSQVRSRVNIRR